MPGNLCRKDPDNPQNADFAAVFHSQNNQTGRLTKLAFSIDFLHNKLESELIRKICP